MTAVIDIAYKLGVTVSIVSKILNGVSNLTNGSSCRLFFIIIFLKLLTTLFNALFFIHIHQNNITSNLLYIAPANHIFFFTAEAPEKFSRNRNNQCNDNPLAYINIHICHKSQSFAISDINYLTIFYFTKTHITSFPSFYIILYVVSYRIMQDNFS